MVYLLKMVIFHGELLNYQRVNTKIFQNTKRYLVFGHINMNIKF